MQDRKLDQIEKDESGCYMVNYASDTNGDGEVSQVMRPILDALPTLDHGMLVMLRTKIDTMLQQRGINYDKTMLAKGTSVRRHLKAIDTQENTLGT